MIEVARVGAEAAADVHAVVRAAFVARPALDPPADALAETETSLAEALARHGGLLALHEAEPAGALVLDPQGDTLFLRRVGVVPYAQHTGVAAALVAAALDEAVGFRRVAVLAREELPGTVRFWRHEGFTETEHEAPYVRLERPAPTRHEAPDAEAMRALGERLAGDLRAGDLVVLSGGLGAGKTTLTRGLGEGLQVRGGVTSPTFVIARVHPSLVDGPALVHVDAYRLGGIHELDDLDLDASLDEAVTVVEWGAGVAEGLADSRLEIRIRRAEGSDPTGEDELDPRTVLVAPVGPRWLDPLGD
ncbi:tRNA (adenosine(37)-N6)-threonylcarbamoyltransferase complex ATPase subunit type 1 TsaE [Nocardioides bigeumensis]|uniref:tRNA threonylcarbamoyladenosine biosynthesis protein TsaE n=1 Tax=Nocardioides bigeumensis TaxID=433657 RepID=A0ABP5JSI3_9ACTN